MVTAAPRGLKPVLIEGTDGRFDHAFQLYRTSFEEAAEALEVSIRLLNKYRSPVINQKHVYSGNHQDWSGKMPSDRRRDTFVLSETSNPEWCFTTALREGGHTPARILMPWDRMLSASKPEALNIQYLLTRPFVGFEYYDFRGSRAPLVKARVEKYNGRFDDDHSVLIDLDLPFEIPLKGRGWGKLNHQHLYDLCQTKGVNLQDPDFLSGRFTIFDSGVK